MIVAIETRNVKLKVHDVLIFYDFATHKCSGKMNGSIAVYYQGQCLVSKPAPQKALVLRAREAKRVMLNKDKPGK